MDECCSESWVRVGCHLQSSGVGSEWLGPSRLWNCQTAVAPTLVLGGPQWRPGEGPKADLPQHPAWKSREDSHPPSVYIEKSMEKRERTIPRWCWSWFSSQTNCPFHQDTGLPRKAECPEAVPDANRGASTQDIDVMSTIKALALKTRSILSALFYLNAWFSLQISHQASLVEQTRWKITIGVEFGWHPSFN